MTGILRVSKSMSDLLIKESLSAREQSSDAHAPVLVVDFGAQYAELIARRIREAKVYSEIVPYTISLSEILDRRPAAVILSGGPASVYAENARTI